MMGTSSSRRGSEFFISTPLLTSQRQNYIVLIKGLSEKSSGTADILIRYCSSVNYMFYTTPVFRMIISRRMR